MVRKFLWRKLYLGMLFSLSAGLGIAQTGPAGYMVIESDTSGIPVFVDGTLAGILPLPAPVLVVPGFHEASSLPTNRLSRGTKSALSQAIRRVYVPSGDTVQVFIYYTDQIQQRDRFQKQIMLAESIGMMIVVIVVTLMWNFLA